MGDTLHMSSSSSKNWEAQRVVTSNKVSSGESLVASSPKSFTQKTVNNVESLYNHGKERGFSSRITIFLLKIAALELTRRFSKAKCPIMWCGLQGLQVLCYPPFKWIQRLAPFKGLVLGIQKLSGPLLFLSIATTFSEQLDHYSDNLDATNDSPPHSEPPGERPVQDTRLCDDVPQNLASENWIQRLHKELEKQNITLPERLDEDELHRFYAAANGDFSCFLSSIKKTIRWRETYKILLAEELEVWSPLVFWHGCDVKLRPCLIIRLGLACSSLPCNERPRFAQAIVSQLEHGVLYLLSMEDPQITVVLDCEGLTPLKFSMQMMRSFSAIFQDHYPNRLCCLFIIRLPPFVRVLTRTFIQVLRPATRQKLRIEGKAYKEVLLEFLQAIPVFLGGQCTCPRCSPRALCDSRSLRAEEADMMEPRGDFPIYGDLYSEDSYQTELNDGGEYDQVLRTAVIAILMVIIFISCMVGMYDLNVPPFQSEH